MAKVSEDRNLGGVKHLHVHKPCNARPECTHKKHGWRRNRANGKSMRPNGAADVWPRPW